MKKIGILTFHFAFNYGAMLQAYALKTHLADNYNVEIINFQPEKTKNTYSLNPFVYGMHPKIILRRIKEWPARKKQADVFEKFKKEYLKVSDSPFYSLKTLKSELEQNDINVFGSDQIWNLDITGETAEYYGGLCNPQKCNIVYAGSFGHDILSEKEKEYINHLKIFDKVSVRENYAKDILAENGIDSTHVSDPVFLVDRAGWSKVAKKPSGQNLDKYILYYTLKNDPKLTAIAKSIAENLKLKLISIHPNANKIDVGMQLYGVGPREFLWLIQNAEYVCTNSFHASAFSVIFKKKLVHSQLEKGKGRVQSLLNTISARNETDSNGINCMDLSKIGDIALEEYLNKSKEFLAQIYEEKENI